MQNELRKLNPGERWNLIAEKREGEEKCVLCPPEDKGLNEIENIEGEKGWEMKVVEDPNQITHPAKYKVERKGLYSKSVAHGWSELLIETRDHSEKFQEMDAKKIKNILKLYQNRLKELRERENVEYVCIYRDNLGREYDHAHSKIVSLPIIPRRSKKFFETFKKYNYQNEECIFCKMIEEDENTQRFITENECFIAIVPYVMERPNNVWIFPKEHKKFEELEDMELFHLSEIIKNVIYRLDSCSSNLNYVLNLQTAPKGEKEFHPFIEIYEKKLHPSLEESYGIPLPSKTPDKTAGEIRGER